MSIKIAALAGGVGGAKLAHGLAQILPPDQLTVIVNTGDDFDHFGLRICPDLDTVCYTLAGLANPATGWGRACESWAVFDALRLLGGPDWFRLGDQDLATHIERTRRLAGGDSLTSITRDFCAAWGVQHPILPVTDHDLRTWVETEEQGWLPFQEYFVKAGCQPTVRGFRFAGADTAEPSAAVCAALEDADWVIICPSNPWVSIGPLLALPRVRALVQQKPVAAVSPIIGGKALKGPAAKMYRELGIAPSALAVAQQYAQDLQRGNKEHPHFVFCIDTIDHALAVHIQENGGEVLISDTVMRSTDDRRRLAQTLLEHIRLFERR